MNINQLIQKTIKIKSIVRSPSTNNWIVNMQDGKDIETECSTTQYEALRYIVPFIQITNLTVDDKIIFQMRENGDMYEILPEDQYKSEDFLVWISDSGDIVTLELELNAGYSGNKTSCYIVRFGERTMMDDKNVGYYSSQSQYFQQTPKGLQEAVNCFLDRINSDKPYRASAKWPGLSIQAIQALMKQKEHPITSEFLINSGYVGIGKYTNKPGLIECYQKKYKDSTGIKYFINIDQYDFRSFKDMKLGYEFQWVMSVRIPNSKLGQWIDVKIPINTSGSIVDFVEAQDTAEQLYREIGGYYCELL